LAPNRGIPNQSGNTKTSRGNATPFFPKKHTEPFRDALHYRLNREYLNADGELQSLIRHQHSNILDLNYSVMHLEKADQMNEIFKRFLVTLPTQRNTGKPLIVKN
jgi:hypothetical protein